MRKHRRLLALICALALVVGMTGVWPAAAATESELRNKLSQLESKEKEIKKSLSEAKEDLSASQQRKNLLDAQIGNVQEQIDLLDSRLSNLNGQVASAQAKIEQKQTAIEEKERSIADTKEKLNQRLRAIMKTGNLTSFQMLLNTQNYTDYLLKSKAIRCIAQKDQGTIDELEEALVAIRSEKSELESQKAALESDKAEINALKANSNAKKKELDTLCAAAQTEVRKMQSTVSGYNTQLSNTQKQIDAANEEIARLIRGTASTGQYNGSMMHWPVPTVRAVSDVFGVRWGTMHRGIDIANGPIPIYGENIVAAADGTVILSNYTSSYGSGWSYGFGYCCVIDHGTDSSGRSVTTLYAHCSAMYARVGQKVVGGKTVIGKAGNTGAAYGPHLHFEVRLDGKSVNPLYTYVSPNVN